jgi:hypothetical protein
MHQHIQDALKILEEIGMPRAQRNERSALTLLALLNLGPEKRWKFAEALRIGITPIMNFCMECYQKKYAPNTRETFRRETMHQFVEAGLVLYNPDDPKRPVNSPKAVYQIEPEALLLVKSFGSNKWAQNLKEYLAKNPMLRERYAKERLHQKIALRIADGKCLQISPGEHSELIKAIIEDFGPRFVPGGEVLYVGETEDKWALMTKCRMLSCIILEKNGLFLLNQSQAMVL